MSSPGGLRTTSSACCTSIRPGHTLGEGGNNLLHALGRGTYHVDRLRKGQPIIVLGNGSSFWPTCHRDDVAVAYEKAVGKKKLRVQYEFGRNKLWGITQRFEFVEWDAEHKVWSGEHVNIGDREIQQFQPHKDDDHLERACQFLAASLAREWEAIAKIAPPLEDDLRRAAGSPAWRDSACLSNWKTAAQTASSRCRPWAMPTLPMTTRADRCGPTHRTKNSDWATS